MSRQTRRILRIVFATIGIIAFVAGTGTVTLVAVLHSPNMPEGVTERALWGSLLYFGIGAVCMYAFVRLK